MRWIVAAAAIVVLAAAGAGMLVALRSPVSQPVALPKPFVPGDGADWPMFHGSPSLAGVAAGSLGDSYRLLWRFKTGGAVVSSPAVVGGTVYVGSSDARVYAIRLADGSKLWSYRTADTVDSSPLVHAGKVYVGSDDGYLYCIDAATGKRLWRFKTGDRIAGAANRIASPDGAGAWIVFGSYDATLYALDAATGTKTTGSTARRRWPAGWSSSAAVTSNCA